VIVPQILTDPRPVDVLVIGLQGAELLLNEPAQRLLGADTVESLAGYVRGWDLAGLDTLSPAAGSVLALPLRSDTRVVLYAGLGDGSPADLRIAAVAIGRAVAARPDSDAVAVAIDAPDHESSRALAEGLVLGGYDFSLASDAQDSLHLVQLLGDYDVAGLAAGDAAADAAGWARDLGNLPADRLTPANFGERAIEQLTAAGCTVQVREPDWLAEQGFGGVLAVGGGASASPRLIHANWTPPGRGAAKLAHIVLVGKGITFDSGGLNLKRGGSMKTMYTDMCGGAAVLAALHFAAVQQLAVRVTALVPAAENSVSEHSMRPSDVITHFGGRTTEVGNTDAEGRLVLADALAFAATTLKPDVVIDVATLTGAMQAALGLGVAGYFANDDALATALESAAALSAEPIWRMPLEHFYDSTLDSPVADARNDPGMPGAITAALFLQPFVNAGGSSAAWAHLDIAGTARAAVAGPIVSRGATGFGARLLARYLEAVAN
jgi:leucyl aminopeptidase